SRVAIAFGVMPCSTRLTSAALNSVLSAALGIRSVSRRNAKLPKSSSPMMSVHRSRPRTVTLVASLQQMSLRTSSAGASDNWLSCRWSGSALGEQLLQLAADQLPGGVAGQRARRHEDEVLGQLERRQMLPAGRAQRVGGHLAVVRDDGDRHLAPRRVGAADDTGLQHAGQAQQDALDLGRVDVLATAFDHVLDAVDEREPAVGL